MKTPHVEFDIHPELDKLMISYFFGSEKAGEDFDDRIFKYHPELKKQNYKDPVVIDSYFNEFYKKNSSELQSSIKSFGDSWNQVENKYLELVTDLFEGHEFPQGDYIGYVSIFNGNPRLLDSSSFLIFYKNTSPVSTISHELLHFMFYAYITKGMNQNDKNIEQSSELNWKVSEVFNDVVLDSEEFKRILRVKPTQPYGELIRYKSKAKKLYEDSKNIAEFISRLKELIEISKD